MNRGTSNRCAPFCTFTTEDSVIWYANDRFEYDSLQPFRRLAPVAGIVNLYSVRPDGSLFIKKRGQDPWVVANIDRFSAFEVCFDVFW